MLAEVILCSCLKTIDAVPKEDLIGVHGKDLRLGKSPLDLNGEHDLLNLAAEVLVGGEEKITRELHRQR